jgi:chorismate mutase
MTLELNPGMPVHQMAKTINVISAMAGRLIERRMVIMAAVGRASTKVGDLSRDDTERDVAKPWHLEASSQGVSI